LFTFFLKQFFLKDLSSQIKIKNFCLESGGVKNLNKNLGLSRIKVRELTTLRLFSGLKKIS
jgi:ribosomal protein S14